MFIHKDINVGNMVSLKLQNCTVQVSLANSCLLEKVQFKMKRRKIEWICPKCGAKNQIKVENLPYEFKGGDDWSRVIRGAAYSKELEKLIKSKCDLMSFLTKKAELKEKYLKVADKELQIKRVATTRIEETCKKCGIKIFFNMELSANSKLLPLLSISSEESILEDLEAEILPEDNVKTIEQIVKGYQIYTLMRDNLLFLNRERKMDYFSHKGKLEEVSQKNLLEWIDNLKNDLEKIVLLEEVEKKIEEIMKCFKTEEAVAYLSDIISFIRKIKRLVFRRTRRKLFLSLGWLEEHVESMILKRS